MAAAPQRGLITFRGQSGKLYTYAVYISDVAAAFVTWATTGTAGTGSTTFIIAPENMQLVDYSIVTGLTDTTIQILWLNDAPVPNTVIFDANIVNTLQSRSFPPFKVAQGRKVQLAQA